MVSLKRPLYVLSIDFDYFQQVKADTLKKYPDGIDLPTDITMMTWMTKYLMDYDEIMAVTADDEKIGKLIKVIRKMPISAPNMAVNSHVHIYDFIKDNLKDHNGCRIMHVDMHHDCVNDNPELDCGNWVSHIMKDVHNCQVKWITNPVSKEVYGLPDDFTASYNFDEMTLFDYDCLFLCRSDNWTPPHLDGAFDRILSAMKGHFIRTLEEASVIMPRDMDEIMMNVDGLKEQMRRFKREGTV